MTLRGLTRRRVCWRKPAWARRTGLRRISPNGFYASTQSCLAGRPASEKGAQGAGYLQR